MTANPVWVPGSLTNTELEGEIETWRGVTKALGTLGFVGVGGKVQSSFQNLLKDPAATLKGFKVTRASGAIFFGTVAASIAKQSLDDLQSEASRRGLLGTMTALHAKEYGN